MARKEKRKQFQIHIGGSQRSGKTLLARALENELSTRGFNPVVIDIDCTRVSIFGLDEPYDSPGFKAAEKQNRQATAYRVAYLRVDDVLTAGGTPIMTATHSRLESYEQALALAQAHGTILRFILLEPVSMEEFLRRAQQDVTSSSDMRGDLQENHQVQRVFVDTTRRFMDSYSSSFMNVPHLWIKQEDPGAMAARAIQYVLRGA